MNIFVLDKDPKLAAQYHCDKHIVKMPLETAQMLSAVLWKIDIEAPYRLSHKNHPCTLWVSESIQNWNWLVRLGIELCDEYTKRYNKQHACKEVILKCDRLLKESGIELLPDKELTDFAQCVPDDCKDPSDVVNAYRQYYIKHKSYMAAWKYTSIPDWFLKSILLIT